MKTTGEIPNELYRRAKAVAALRGRKLKDLVEEGLRRRAAAAVSIWLGASVELAAALAPSASISAELVRSVQRAEIPNWDGTGEIFVARPDSTIGTTTFTIGAAFDPKGLQCFKESRAYLAHVARSRIHFLIPGPSTQSLHKSAPSTFDSQSTSERVFVFADENCRIELRMRARAVHDGKLETLQLWGVEIPSDRGESVVSSPLPIRLGTGQPYPSEFPSTSEGFGADFAEPSSACPQAVGMMTINHLGVYFTFPWASANFLPGLQRLPEERVSVLTFGMPECRLEVSARKEVRQDGRWISVPLAPLPQRDKQEFK